MKPIYVEQEDKDMLLNTTLVGIEFFKEREEAGIMLIFQKGKKRMAVCFTKGQNGVDWDDESHLEDALSWQTKYELGFMDSQTEKDYAKFLELKEQFED